MNTEANEYINTLVRGYTEETRCLQFMVTFDKHNLDLVVPAVRKALKGGYNDFSAARFCTAFAKIQSNVFKLRFGRNYSPECHIIMSPFATPEQIDEVVRAFKSTKPDECSVIPGGDPLHNTCVMIRLWWD